MANQNVAPTKRPWVRIKRYTFFSDGTYTIFDPNRMTKNDRPRSLLDVYKAEVAFRDSPTVFILDEKGEEVSPFA